MSKFQITDHLSGELVTVQPSAFSAFQKYLSGLPSNLVASAEAALALRSTLAASGGQGVSFPLKFAQDLELGSTEAKLSLRATIQPGVSVHKGPTLLPGGVPGEPITIPAGKAFVSFGFPATIQFGVSEPFGDLTFGFQVGAAYASHYYKSFSLSAGLTVLDATKQVLESYILPGDIADVQAMDVDDVAVVQGSGSLQFSASFDVAAIVNPLAVAAAPLGVGSLNVKAGASLTVGARVRLSGEYQVRVQKIAAKKVRIGCYRASSLGLTFSVNAAVSASVTLGKRELLQGLLKQLQVGEDEIAALASSTLTDEQAQQILDLANLSLSRRMELSFSTELSALRKDEAALLYEIDLAKLERASPSVQAAVDRALDGDLSGLSDLDSAEPSSGVKVVRSVVRTVREKKTSWRLSFFGLYNVISISRMIVDGTALWEPDSGEFILAEKATAERMRVSTTSLPNADQGKLREAMFESMLLTATYRASKLGTDLQLKAAQSYFELGGSSRRETMLDHLDALVGLGLLTAAQRDASLPAGVSHFGNSTLSLESTFDQSACEALFFTSSNKSRPLSEYETIGRNALLSLLRREESDDLAQPRRAFLSNDTLWKSLRETAGTGSAFDTGLPPALRPHAPVLGGDMALICWWAEAMQQAAKNILEMREFLGNRSAADLVHDHGFKKKKEALEDSLRRSLAHNRRRFSDPWGLIALAQAGGKKVLKHAVIASDQFRLEKP